MMKMLFSDPEIMALMSQPGVGEAIQEIMSDPQGGLAKHQGNPAVMAAFQKYTATILLASGLHSSQYCCGQDPVEADGCDGGYGRRWYAGYAGGQ